MRIGRVSMNDHGCPCVDHATACADRKRCAMSDKAVTQMTDPKYTVEFDGKETYVMCNGVKLAMRRDDCWVSIEAGVTVRDVFENGQRGIEISYSRVTIH